MFKFEALQSLTKKNRGAINRKHVLYHMNCAYYIRLNEINKTEIEMITNILKLSKMRRGLTIT